MLNQEKRSEAMTLNRADFRKTVRDMIIAGVVIFGMSQYTTGEYSIYIDAVTYGIVQLVWRYVKQN